MNSHRHERWIDWFFGDRRTGRLTIGQPPNAPLVIFVIATVGHLALPATSALSTLAGWIGSAALAFWCLDELVRGVNPWRRLLGAGVLLGQVLFRVHR